MMTRRTFYPIPWDETHEKELVKARDARPDRLRQVWFAGAHASVGGGYPDDGLSLVALGWMIGEATDKELRFIPSIVAEFAALANPTGRIYDPRSGLGAFYRYQPRDAQQLLDESNTPLVNGSVMTRIVSGTEWYAPISLPEKINVLPPHGPPVAFDVPAVTAAQARSEPGGKALSSQQKLILNNTLEVAKKAAALSERSDLFKLVLDTVWWRRVNYFVSILFVSVALLFPALPIPKNEVEEAARGPVATIMDLITGFLPWWFLGPWITAVRQHPLVAAAVVIGLLLNLRVSAFLQGRIRDRARAAWNMGIKAKPLRLTGQRSAALSLALLFGVLATGALSTWFWEWAVRVDTGWIVFFSVGAGVFLALWQAFRRGGGKPKEIDPAKPGFLLNLARKMRTGGWVAGVYRNVEKIFAPAVLLLLAALAVLSLLHRGAFDIASASGAYCTNTKDMADLGDEKLDVSPTFDTKSMCQPTGIRLVEGLKYRIEIDMKPKDDKDKVKVEWFDKGRRADVAGFAPEFGDAHYFRFLVASPFKRWWRENWFQPIARIGKVGNNEHVLRPAEPLPVVNFKKCAQVEEKSPSGWEADISSPAPEEFRAKELTCEGKEKIEPDRTLISDVTADATGELFIYVNDDVLVLPGLEDLFYRNNSGTAKITVKRVEAEPIIKAPPEGI